VSGIAISEERIQELAEQEIVRYVHDIMTTFQNDRIAESDHFDPRMQEIVDRTVREIVYKKYQNRIDEAVSKIAPQKFVELIVDQLRYMGVIKSEDDDER
jgi:predicted metalloprotease